MIKLQPSRPDDTFWDQTMIDDLFGKIEGNIFVIPGEYEGAHIDQINEEINKHPYAVVMITSDENSNFPYKALSHPRMKVWMQYPKEWHEVDHYLPAGYSPNSKFNIPKVKELDWFWGGQVTHQDRFELVEQLRKMDNGFLLESEGFTQGIDLQDYLDLMATAKFVPIPRGNISPDTMRLYDALQLNCMPVIRNRDKPFYQRLLGGEAESFVYVENWSDLPSILDKYDNLFGLWNAYKNKLCRWMVEDIRCLQS